MDSRLVRGKLSRSHLIFDVPSEDAVTACFSSALKAGAEPNKAPAGQDRPDVAYAASVLDLDGHCVEFLWSEPQSLDMSAVSSTGSARVSEHQAQSVVPRSQAPQPSPLHAVVTSIVTTTSTAMKATASPSHETATGSSKALTGTLIGAAAGATIAYVMMKAEQPPSPPSQPHEASRATVTHRFVDTSPRPSFDVTDHRRGSVDPSRGSGSVWDSGATYVRAIEGAPSNHAAGHSHVGTSANFPRALPAPRSARPATVSMAWTHESSHAPVPASRSTTTSHKTRASQRELLPLAHTGRSATCTMDAAQVSLPPLTPPSVRRSTIEGPVTPVARSAAGHSAASASTVRPLTRANVERASAAGASGRQQSSPSGGALPAALDDMATVAPSDSISQTSSRRHKKHLRRRTSDDGARSNASKSAATLPEWGAKKDRETRSVATVLGLRGRS